MRISAIGQGAAPWQCYVRVEGEEEKEGPGVKKIEDPTPVQPVTEGIFYWDPRQNPKNNPSSTRQWKA